MNVIIAYDVSDDDRRARLAALLGRHGVRIQKSVFQCVLDTATAHDLIEQAESLLNLNHDVLHLFPQCEPCSSSQHAIGQVNRTMDQYYWIV